MAARGTRSGVLSVPRGMATPHTETADRSGVAEGADGMRPVVAYGLPALAIIAMLLAPFLARRRSCPYKGL